MQQRDRYLSLAEVAELMKLKQESPGERRRHVRRLLRRLEQRDGTTYLHRFAKGRGKLLVSVSALEQLMPWDPGTLTAIRSDINGVGAGLRHLKREVKSHGARLSKLEQWRTITQRYLLETSALLGPE